MTDLAERLGVDTAAITVTVYEGVTWRDGSLGCPKPDMMYTMALVPGRRMVLTVDGKDYAYHADRTSDFFYAPSRRPTRRPPVASAPTPDPASLRFRIIGGC